MKACVKATGEIVEISPYWTEIHTTNGGCYEMTEVELMPDVPDYWTRLEHQYAGMAMQGILSNSEYLRSLMHTKYNDYSAHEVVPNVAMRLAHALVEKYKKEDRL
jgi:hypothetical protein